jgi:peptidoglycan/LPS O-acetylase OafA/YrhL
MSGEGARNGNGYEHAGGYQPDVPLWPSMREIVDGTFFALVGLATNRLLDELVPGAPARELFYLIVCAVILVPCAWMTFKASRLDPGEHVANPMSVLYPERIEDDAKARRRRGRVWAALGAVLALAGFAYCLRALLERPVPLDQVPTVILLAAAFFLILLLPPAYRRRRRQSSTE